MADQGFVALPDEIEVLLGKVRLGLERAEVDLLAFRRLLERITSPRVDLLFGVMSEPKKCPTLTRVAKSSPDSCQYDFTIPFRERLGDAPRQGVATVATTFR